MQVQAASKQSREHCNWQLNRVSLLGVKIAQDDWRLGVTSFKQAECLSGAGWIFRLQNERGVAGLTDMFWQLESSVLCNRGWPK